MVKFILVSAYLGILFLSLISLGLYIFGAIRYFTDLEPNTCDMTFMFEYPQYVRIELVREMEKKYPAFALYAYGEGHNVDKLRRKEFNGIPVLFIPGNAGSHEQVRSIASISLRMSLKHRTPFHFDYFTVSFAEGLSAFYGGILEEQSLFVSGCIRQILKLYNGKVSQIVLIGHSMGGIVAKSALLHNSSANMSLASILINLASPQYPRIAFDKTFTDYYQKIKNQQERLRKMGTSIISIGGGSRDVMVSSSQIENPVADLNIISSAIPNVWRSLDHLCILWCKQFLIVLNRALFNCVDYSKKIPIITTNSTVRREILTYHLARRFATKHLSFYEVKKNFSLNGQWIKIIADNYTFDRWDSVSKKKDALHFIIPLNFGSKYSHVSVDVVDVETKDWLFACTLTKENSFQVCEWGWNLTNRTIQLPDYQHRLRKSVDLELQELYFSNGNRMTHIVIRIAMDDIRKKIPPTIHVDRYLRDSRNTNANVSGPSWLPTFISNIIAPYQKTVIKIPFGNTRHFINITGVHDAVYVILEAITSNNYYNDSQGYVIIRMVESTTNPNSIISQFFMLSDRDIGRINTFRMQIASDSKNLSDVVEMEMNFDPRFSYVIVICRASMIDRAASLVRDRWPKLYPMMISLLLLSIAMRVDNSEYKMSMTVIVICITGLWYCLYQEILVALGILLLLSIALCCAIVFLGSLTHTLTARFLAKSIARLPISWFDWLLRHYLEHLSLFSSVVLIVLVSNSCAAVAMLLSAILYFLKLTRMYEDYLENLLMASFRDIVKKMKKLPQCKRNKSIVDNENGNIDATANIINHMLLFIMWCLTAASAIPSTLVWAKNFSHESRLSTEDMTMFISWITLTGWGSLGLVTIPSMTFPKKNLYYIQSILLFQRVLGCSLMWISGSSNTADHQWKIPPIVATFVSSIVLLSIISKNDKCQVNVKNENNEPL